MLLAVPLVAAWISVVPVDPTPTPSLVHTPSGSTPTVSFATPVDDELARELERLGERLDGADSELFARVAAHGSGAALDGLLAIYPRLTSVFGRRAVLRVLHRFPHEAERLRVVRHLVEVALRSPSALLRGEALDALAACADGGAEELKRIVSSPVAPSIREAAMLRLVRAPRAADHAWYLEQYLSKADVAQRRSRGRDEDGAVGPNPRVRELAFEAVRSTLGEIDLADACRDLNREIRMSALLELERLASHRTLPIARDHLNAPGEHHAVRSVAAGVLWRALGPKVLDHFLDLGSDHVSSLALRYALADLLGQAADADIERKLLPLLKRGKDFQKLFAIRALRSSSSPKARRQLLRALGDKSPIVSFAAILAAGERGDPGASEALRKSFEDARDPTLAAAALEALDAVVADRVAWGEELVRHAQDPRVPVRSTALRALARGRAKDAAATLIGALGDENWAVRLAALRGLESARFVGALAPIVERMALEGGRLRAEFAETLWRLSGQPFGDHVELWRAWLIEEGRAPDFVSAAELEVLRQQRLERRLRATSLTVEGAGADVRDGAESTLFGLRVESEQVLFVVDVSLSMELGLREGYGGDPGVRRFDVARRELLYALEHLTPTSTFGVFAFSARLVKWKAKGLEPVSESNLSSVRKFVEKLTMGSGTDLWQALDEALELEDVDTIYLLSDGEPEGGSVVDPVELRLEFRRRNLGRGVRVHAIALGDDIALLEWLAKDSGGAYTRLR